MPPRPRPRPPWIPSVFGSLAVHAVVIALAAQLPRIQTANGEPSPMRVATLTRFTPDPTPLEPRREEVPFETLDGDDENLPFPALRESPERLEEWTPPRSEHDPFAAPPVEIPARMDIPRPERDSAPAEPELASSAVDAAAELPQGATPRAASFAHPPPGKPLETAPVLVDGPPPSYPLLARRHGLSGAALLRLTVGSQGLVVAISIERSSGHAVLDKAARTALARWRFQPGERDGRPVSMDVLKEVAFQLPE